MFKSPSVTIRGSGIAAYCCAFLLNEAGISTAMEGTGRAKLPAILLSPAALALLRDIFKRPDLLRNLPEVHRRVVVWGPTSTPVVVDHSAVTVSEEFLLETIRSSVVIKRHESIANEWSIIASHPLPAGCEEHRFGTRTAFVTSVKLTGTAAMSSCWIESVETGWLFLIENGPTTGCLLGIGDTLASLLDQSSVIRKQIEQLGESSGEVPVHPRISTPLGDLHWLACGSAAMAFDPICGDGTANAVREAILAAAVIRAALQDGADIQALLSHYETRLLAGFRRHLAMCLPFYTRGYGGRWWDEECAALRRGLGWCDSRLAKSPSYRYRLEGLELIEL